MPGETCAWTLSIATKVCTGALSSSANSHGAWLLSSGFLRWIVGARAYLVALRPSAVQAPSLNRPSSWEGPFGTPRSALRTWHRNEFGQSPSRQGDAQRHISLARNRRSPGREPDIRAAQTRTDPRLSEPVAERTAELLAALEDASAPFDGRRHKSRGRLRCNPCRRCP
jgi:hypothetical protein